MIPYINSTSDSVLKGYWIYLPHRQSWCAAFYVHNHVRYKPKEGDDCIISKEPGGQEYHDKVRLWLGNRDSKKWGCKVLIYLTEKSHGDKDNNDLPHTNKIELKDLAKVIDDTSKGWELKEGDNVYKLETKKSKPQEPESEPEPEQNSLEQKVKELEEQLQASHALNEQYKKMLVDANKNGDNDDKEGSESTKNGKDPNQDQDEKILKIKIHDGTEDDRTRMFLELRSHTKKVRVDSVKNGLYWNSQTHKFERRGAK